MIPRQARTSRMADGFLARDSLRELRPCMGNRVGVGI